MLRRKPAGSNALWVAGVAVALVGGSALAAAAPAPTAPGAAIDWSAARKFWSFQPPQAQARPRVKRGMWVRQPIDAFILAKLEANKLNPAPEADRHTLFRRATYDLTGLPPTPEETAAFMADTAPGAYERLIERLLASPRFGERLASMWLPLARYAEDQAHQVGADTKFFYPNAYKYREWVINAFNRDLPYNQFVKLQVAADRVAQPGSDDFAALGFLGLGPKYYNRNRLDVMADEWQDRVDTVTRTFLGLTVACARCHDHKYDPITMSDYYALAGVFASTQMVNRTADGKVEDAKAEAVKMSPRTLHMVEDEKPHDITIFLRGNVEKPGPVAPRRFLRVLSENEPEPFKEGSGRRELAEAIASDGNPLTARVIVNRIWGEIFGRPLVSTPSNFGILGEKPTHPELLDDLSVRFVRNGWSVKSLVREMMLSATYRQSAIGSGKAPVNDPANRLLWKMNRRRLTVEQWRDTLLATAGQLDLSGGPSKELDDPTNLRRTVYTRVSRLKLNDLLAQFDYPDANVHAEKRPTTNTPMQKLFVLNGSFVMTTAKQLVARVNKDVPADDPEARIQRAYQLLFARPAESDEVRLGADFVSRPSTGAVSRWEQYAQMLLATNELLYVD